MELDLAQNEQIDKNTEMRKLAAKWYEAAENGLDPRSALGQQFARDKKEGGLSPAYINGVNRVQKAKFRADYAKMKGDRFEAMTSETTSWKKVDTSKGTYRSIPYLLRTEGHDPCKIYLPKMAKLGPPWIRWDDLWERWDVLVLERSSSEIFTQAWELRKQWIASRGSSGTPANSSSSVQHTLAGSGQNTGNTGAEPSVQNDQACIYT